MPDLMRASGELVESPGRFWCTSRYCSSCRLHYQQRVYACIDSTLDVHPHLVTLTLRLPSGLSDYQLRRNVQHIRAAQRPTHQTLRDHDYAWQRLEYWRRRRNPEKVRYWTGQVRDRIPSLPEIARRQLADETLDEYASSWSPLTGWERADRERTTYIWCVEITTGADDDRWHVHLHYMVPTRGDAERLNAAWQMHRGQRDFARTDISSPDQMRAARAADWAGDGQKALARTDISAPAGGYHAASGREAPTDTADAAAYLTAYVSKDALDDIPDHAIAGYVGGAHGLRRYDAAGDWRPLGVSRRTESDDPCVWAVYDDGVVEPIQQIFNGQGEQWGEHLRVWAAGGREAVQEAREAFIERSAIMLLESREQRHAERSGCEASAARSLAQYRSSLSHAPGQSTTAVSRQPHASLSDLYPELARSTWRAPP